MYISSHVQYPGSPASVSWDSHFPKSLIVSTSPFHSSSHLTIGSVQTKSPLPSLSLLLRVLALSLDKCCPDSRLKLSLTTSHPTLLHPHFPAISWFSRIVYNTLDSVFRTLDKVLRTVHRLVQKRQKYHLPSLEQNFWGGPG